MKINNFLKKIRDDIKNTNREFSYADFYYMLKYIEVNQSTQFSDDIETFYQDFLDSLNNSLVKYETKKLGNNENTTYYLGLYADASARFRDAVKVYFPVKYEYVVSSLKTIFVYLIRNNIKATVKFHLKATNEGIVIRFYKKEEVLPFINYCNNNFILKDLLVATNPFIATIYGIGIVFDDNKTSTYNKTLCRLLEKYFKYMNNNNLLDKVSDLDFLNFIINLANNLNDEIMEFNINSIINNITAIINHNSPISEKDLI